MRLHEFHLFGLNEKGTPVFLNEEPYPQVGTMYLMKAWKNSAIGITLDDKVIKLVKAPGEAVRGRKPKAEAEVAPKKRGRKPNADAGASTEKKAKKPGRPKVKKEKVEKKVEEKA